ncbi:MAG: 2-oxoacid:acceptor oxidoreductase subunit alpha, partial [Sporomusaceae bacterium]|nr:2-oxoacid:acceptor oxidoreductase subunit alpha [Sporomusaceae bacterium]
MSKKSFTAMFGGQAGYGVMSAGSTVAKAASRYGLWAIVVNEYPSLIKGGLNDCLVQIGSVPQDAYDEELDFLGAFSQPAWDQNINKLKPGAVALYDDGAVKPDLVKLPEGVQVFPVKLVQSLESGDEKVMVNSAMLAAFCALTGFSSETILHVFASEFTKADVLEKNMSLFHKVFTAVQDEYKVSKQFPFAFEKTDRKKMLINGNDAISLGALAAGVTFAAGYPMTPGSSVLTYLADHGDAYGLVFKQAEDEIAAMNMLIGAGFGGVRAIGATSGGGFALMVEALGFAAQAEIPVVMVLAQRGGPSTGLPTRTAQADLNFVYYSSQGEFPRLIVAPGDVDECFYETFRVFNLAEKYQMPAIILTDKYLADSSWVQDFFDQSGLAIERSLADEDYLASHQPYLRYSLTENGVSPRSFPGQKGGRHIATSYTHGADGFYSSGNREYAAEEPSITEKGTDKLFNKVEDLLKEIPSVKLHGPEMADLTVIGWGSSKGAILAAMDEVAQQGVSVNYLQVLYPSPFPTAAVEAVLQKAKKT